MQMNVVKFLLGRGLRMKTDNGHFKQKGYS
jgi:hypothetical protein